MQDQLSKAKFGVMLKGSTFLLTIMLGLKHELSDRVPTAGTTGVHVYYNPEFFAKLTEEQRIGLIVHECWHVALNHLVRGTNKIKEIYNMAGDFVINLLVTQAGFTLPPKPLLDYKYVGWTTEEVYEDLLQNPPVGNCCLMEDLLEPDTSNGDMDTVEIEIRDLIVRAVTQTKLLEESLGSVPDEILRVIDQLINPKLAWNSILMEYLTEKQKQDINWKRPNKKYFPQFIMPSCHSPRLENITVAIDTSGSIEDSQLKAFLSEIQYIHQVLKPETLTVIDCDCRLNHVYEINEYDDVMDLEFKGGGGTSFRPVITYCESHTPSVLIYFTDLEGLPIRDQLQYEVIWICYSKHPPAPIGRTIYYE